MERLVQVRDLGQLLRSAANVEYWIRSLVPIEKKSTSRASRGATANTGRRHFDHNADFDIWIVLEALLEQLGLRLGQQLFGAAQPFSRLGDHREHDTNVVLSGRAENQS